MATEVVVIILGIVQGLTEFLPVSSSGHLVLAQRLLGVSFPGVTFEVVVHLGTLVAVFMVFWEDIVGVIGAFLKGIIALVTGKRPQFTDAERVSWRFAWLIIIGSIPTFFMGVFLDPIFEELFDSTLIVGSMLLITGTLLWVIEGRRGEGGKTIGEMRPMDALFIGIAQGCAIMPGLSRSGSTISGALFRGHNRDTAMRFSFLLGSPAIAGATIFKAGDILAATTATDELGILHYGLGLLVAAVAGVVAIKLLYRVLLRGKLHLFAYYCWAVGFLTLAISLFPNN